MINKYWLWVLLIICIIIVFLWGPYVEVVQNDTKSSQSVVTSSTK